MKKIALTSLIAMFTVAGAHAANVIDGNPLYMPKAGHFYSETSLETHSTSDRVWALGEAFGYGITDKLAVEVGTDLTESDGFDEYAWDDISLDLAFRALDMNGWKVDAMAGYAAGSSPFGGGLYSHSNGHGKWFNKDNIAYMWSVGVRGGYVASNWTIAGHAIYDYMNSESFNWNDKGVHVWNLGLDAQYILCPKWNVTAGVDYVGVTNDKWSYDGMSAKVKNAGVWSGELGLNYNIDATKYVGAYVSGEINHQGGKDHDDWKWENGFGMGVKFGIDF